MNPISKIVRKRPVCIMAHGPSVKQLEERIEEFKDADVCWASINHFKLLEDGILSKIGKRLELVYMTAPIRIQQNTQNLKNFMDRKDNNLWITYHPNSYNKEKTLLDFNSPAHGKLNTLFAFVLLLKKLNIPEVYLFGADGGVAGKDVYYKEDNFELNKKYEGEMSNKTIPLLNDTKVANAIYQRIAEQYDSRTKIYNCNPDSFIKCFPKITYDEAKERLCHQVAEKK